MKSMIKATLVLSAFAVLLMSAPLFAEEPKAKETPAAETQKASAMKKTLEDKAKSDKRDIQEETARTQKDNIRLGEPKR